MLIFGHKDIESETFYPISAIQDISRTPSNSTVLCKFDIEILKFTKKNSVSVAVEVETIQEAVLSEQFGVKYIISNVTTSSEMQKIADNYLYDSKILVWIHNISELEKIAKLQIDGVIFNESKIKLENC